MTVYTEPFPHIVTPCVLALGTFDGVHVGHGAVIDRAVDIARSLDVPAAVWCFRDLPRNFFTKDSPTPLICTPDEKLDLIAARGVDIAVCPDVDADILSLSPSGFLENIIGSLHPLHVVCGFNYTFGAHAGGNTDTLRGFLDMHSIPLTVVEPVMCGGVPVSSTLIREKLARGEYDIQPLLGRRYNAPNNH